MTLRLLRERISWEGFFEELLPLIVRWSGDEGVYDEADELYEVQMKGAL